jgi:hypothetical protein
MSKPASQKQIDYIINLWNQANGESASYLSQTDLPLTQREKRGGMFSSEASRYIDQLKRKLANS